MFASTDLARRIERAESELSADIAHAAGRRSEPGAFAMPLWGGVATFAGPGSPINKFIGAGFDPADPLDDTALALIEGMFAERQTPMQAEIAILADPRVAATLTRRGFVLEGFENVLGRRLEPAAAGDGAVTAADRSGVIVRRVEPSEEQHVAGSRWPAPSSIRTRARRRDAAAGTARHPRPRLHGFCRGPRLSRLCRDHRRRARRRRRAAAVRRRGAVLRRRHAAVVPAARRADGAPPVETRRCAGRWMRRGDRHDPARDTLTAELAGAMGSRSSTLGPCSCVTGSGGARRLVRYPATGERTW